MKNNYTFKSLAIVLSITLISTIVNSQIRLTEVDPATNTIKIHNYGSSTVNISSYWLCSLFDYEQLSSSTLVSGSLSLTANSDVIITSVMNINDPAADLGLYNSPTFTSTTAMVDFTQWGSAGNGRESVAVAKGIWTVSTFIGVAPPYQYIGNGFQNGSTFWSTLLGLEDFKKSIDLSVVPNPVKSNLFLKVSNQITNGSIKIYDFLGKEILKHSFSHLSKNEIQIDITNLSKGIYLVKIASEEQSQTKQFIKN